MCTSWLETPRIHTYQHKKHVMKYEIYLVKIQSYCKPGLCCGRATTWLGLLPVTVRPSEHWNIEVLENKTGCFLNKQDLLC